MSRSTATRLAWSIWILNLALILFVLLLQYLNDLASFPENIFNALVLLVFATVGTLIASQRATNPIGWLFCAGTLLWAAGQLMLEYAVYTLITVPDRSPGGAWMAWLGSWAQGAGFLLVLTFPLLFFPDGRLPSPRWRPVAWLAVSDLALFTLWVVLRPGLLDFRFPFVRNPIWSGLAPDLAAILDIVAVAVEVLTIIACGASVIARVRQAKGNERQQLKWLIYAAFLTIAMFGVIIVLVQIVTAEHLGSLGSLVFDLAAAGIPTAVGIAILRYHLYDIDFLINRTLVYGALTASITGIYGLIVGTLSMLFQASGNALISLLAAGLVAVLFAPLRDQLQRGVNRLMYGERDDPYRVLARLGERLEGTLAADRVFPAIVETIAGALKLPYAAIALKQGEVFRLAAAHGQARGPLLTLPLTYHAEPIGELRLAPRAPGEPFTLPDRRLLDDLARQVGVAAHAIRLSADLQRSRERLVTAREEERRRLRRDLHDGLGPQLASLTLKLEALQNRVAHDPVADALLADVTTQMQAAIAEIRRLVYALRPAVLDELGLAAALREVVAQYNQPGPDRVRITMEGPEALPPLSAAVEVAAYRIAQEALTNVVRHAKARSCVVHLALDQAGGALTLEIADDGRGLDRDHGRGVGLASMRERAEELGGTCHIEPMPGGGTRVRVQLPCAAGEAPGEVHRGPTGARPGKE
jgi:two-component system, NarL family, sensor kinase